MSAGTGGMLKERTYGAVKRVIGVGVSHSILLQLLPRAASDFGAQVERNRL